MNMSRIMDLRNALLDILRSTAAPDTPLDRKCIRRIADCINSIPGELPQISPALLQQISSMEKSLDDRNLRTRALAPVKHSKRREKIIFHNWQSPGDIVMLTAAVRDLMIAHGDKYLVDVRTPVPDIWFNNPYLTRLDEKAPDVRMVKAEYPLINQSNQSPYHFIHGFRLHMEKVLGVDIPATVFKGDIFLSQAEKDEQPLVEKVTGKPGPYWIIVNGGKMDYTAKWWDPAYAQQVVDMLPNIRFAQCGDSKSHKHSKLNNVVDLLGKTTFRELIKVVYNAAGIICPVTCYMHLAMAVEPNRKWMKGIRPCVVIGGGREPVQWEAYPGHQYLNTIGMLDCCSYGGCWRSRVQKIGDGDSKDESLCVHPVKSAAGGVVPKCMSMITAQDVVAKIRAYQGADHMAMPEARPVTRVGNRADRRGRGR